MKKKTLLYIPLPLLFAFVMSALVSHYGNFVGTLNLDPKPYSIPFGYFNGAATNLTEKANISFQKPTSLQAARSNTTI